ncbi:MAG TPA: alpha/beta fold hydrolase [Xanthobacteraceae bacterium]|nr:alpha/beta fold hydrolase [Xanthobacteraceae bacterium]
MAVFVVAHGAWAAGWAWKKMRPLMAAAGHTLFTPTYTGLGERAHLAHSDLNLESHIRDMLAVFEFENLRNVILIGHSYGGMVATGVADRLRDKIRHLVYLDAFVPEDGMSAADYMPADRAELMVKSAVDGWKVPPSPAPPDTTLEDAAWVMARRVPTPLQCFEQKLVFKNGPLSLPRTYIYAQRHNPGDPFRQFMDRARADGWPVYEMDASHSPHVTAPEALMGILQKVAASG